MSKLFRDAEGEIEFVDGDAPTKKALKMGILTYRIVGFNPITGNRVAEVMITKKGQDYFLRTLPVGIRNHVGGCSMNVSKNDQLLHITQNKMAEFACLLDLIGIASEHDPILFPAVALAKSQYHELWDMVDSIV